MLVDWLTLRVPYSSMAPSVMRRCASFGDRIRRYDPVSGEVAWESAAWDSIRSDSHQVSMRAASDCFFVQGSPARAMGDGDAVFGMQPFALDLRVCVAAMLRCASSGLGATLPMSRQIAVTRIDVTGNLLLRSLSEVRSALSILRSVEGGRYRVSQQSGDTVYWSHGSRLRSGKAYAKGPHLRYLAKRDGRSLYSSDMLRLADRLLRLELRIGSQFLRERCCYPWADLPRAYLEDQWSDYFGRMLGAQEIVDVDEKTLLARVCDAAGTKRRGRAAWGTWALIQAVGWQSARDQCSSSTWYRHLEILRAAGLSDADFSSGNVVQLRRPLLLRPVSSWSELLRAA